MKIEDLILLLNSRLREFKLSRDYARMSGDLERMNAAEKEIIGLEDTLYQLNLLVDTSKSAAVKEATLAEVLTDGSVAVLGEYDITSYATDPLHEEKIMNILSKMGVMDTVEQIDSYIQGKYSASPVTGEMILNAAKAYTVDIRLMMAIMEQDSRFGTAGLAVGTLNPGNVGNDDSGNTRTYGSWQDGVTAVAEWLNRHRGSTAIPEIPGTSTSTLPVATSTPEIAPGATSTPSTITPIATSTPITATSTTTTVITIPTTVSTTPVTATSTSTTTTQESEPTSEEPTSEPTSEPSEEPAVAPDTSTDDEDEEEETASATTYNTTTQAATSTP